MQFILKPQNDVFDDEDSDEDILGKKEPKVDVDLLISGVNLKKANNDMILFSDEEDEMKEQMISDDEMERDKESYFYQSNHPE